jgi:SAM-dependent methyltransferase
VPESPPPVPLSALPEEEKARRSSSFGGVADRYEQYRPGPPDSAVDWLLPDPVARVVDLGAGTGALTRLLVPRAEQVVAVEPDDRMRAVLESEVPGAQASAGRGEAIPLADSTAQAVLASSSWHWMDPAATLKEVARVLVTGGVLGALWSGPDPQDPLIVQARSLLSGGPSSDDSADSPSAQSSLPTEMRELAELIGVDSNRPTPTLQIPRGLPFTPPERRDFTWTVALDADGLLGLIGTFSSVILMSDQARQNLLTGTRRVLAEVLGIEGDVTIDMTFRAEVWRSFFTG